MAEMIDLTAVLAKGRTLKIDDKEYEIKYAFRQLRVLEEQYGTVGDAINALANEDNGDIYTIVLNFLYAALGEKYSLKKTDIEEWITVSSAPILYSLIFEAMLESIGGGNGENKQGEA